MKGRIASVKQYKQWCRARGIKDLKKTVFIFPERVETNPSESQSFAARKKQGLANIAELFTQNKLPTLGLPTSGAGIIKDENNIPVTPVEAISELEKLLLAGYNLILPVRIQESATYFFCTLDKNQQQEDIEPSFWGAGEKTGNPILGDYYIDMLKQLYRINRSLTLEYNFISDACQTYDIPFTNEILAFSRNKQRAVVPANAGIR